MRKRPGVAAFAERDRAGFGPRRRCGVDIGRIVGDFRTTPAGLALEAVLDAVEDRQALPRQVEQVGRIEKTLLPLEQGRAVGEQPDVAGDAVGSVALGVGQPIGVARSGGDGQAMVDLGERRRQRQPAIGEPGRQAHIDVPKRPLAAAVAQVAGGGIFGEMDIGLGRPTGAGLGIDMPQTEHPCHVEIGRGELQQVEVADQGVGVFGIRPGQPGLGGGIGFAQLHVGPHRGLDPRLGVAPAVPVILDVDEGAVVEPAPVAVDLETGRLLEPGKGGRRVGGQREAADLVPGAVGVELPEHVLVTEERYRLDRGAGALEAHATHILGVEPCDRAVGRRQDPSRRRPHRRQRPVLGHRPRLDLEAGSGGGPEVDVAADRQPAAQLDLDRVCAISGDEAVRILHRIRLLPRRRIGGGIGEAEVEQVARACRPGLEHQQPFGVVDMAGQVGREAEGAHPDRRRRPGRAIESAQNRRACRNCGRRRRARL